MAVQDLQRIEDKIDRTAAGAIAVSDTVGGILFSNMSEVMEFAKLMSLAGTAVPQHCRGNPGLCLAVCIQALEWRSSPFAVANKTYEVNNRLGYESQLVHAIIEQRAPIAGRLRHRYEGEGDSRVCIVSGTARGEKEPLEYTSPLFGKIQPKNSPLWKTKPDLQLYYNASRDWCRVYFPDVLLGIYTEDELREFAEGPQYAKDVTPKPDVGSRLKGGKGKRGFDADGVTAPLEHKPGETVPETANTAEPEPVAVIEAKAEPEQAAQVIDDTPEKLERHIEALRHVNTPDVLAVTKSEITDWLKAAGREDLVGQWNGAVLARQKAITRK